MGKFQVYIFDRMNVVIVFGSPHFLWFKFDMNVLKMCGNCNTSNSLLNESSSINCGNLDDLFHEVYTVF